MRQEKIDLLASENAIAIRTKKGRRLVQVSEPAKERKTMSVYAMEETIIPPYSECVILGRISKKDRTRCPKDVFIQTTHTQMAKNKVMLGKGIASVNGPVERKIIMKKIRQIVWRIG